MKLKVSIVESLSFLSPSCSWLKSTRKSSSRLPEVLVNYVYLCDGNKACGNERLFPTLQLDWYKRFPRKPKNLRAFSIFYALADRFRLNCRN